MTAWKAIGWRDIDRLKAFAEASGWQSRYDDGSLLILRCPPSIGQAESWKVAAEVRDSRTGRTTRLWWVESVAVRALRSFLCERYGEEFVSVVVDGGDVT